MFLHSMFNGNFTWFLTVNFWGPSHQGFWKFLRLIVPSLYKLYIDWNGVTILLSPFLTFLLLLIDELITFGNLFPVTFQVYLMLKHCILDSYLNIVIWLPVIWQVLLITKLGTVISTFRPVWNVCVCRQPRRRYGGRSGAHNSRKSKMFSKNYKTFFHSKL